MVSSRSKALEVSIQTEASSLLFFGLEPSLEPSSTSGSIVSSSSTFGLKSSSTFGSIFSSRNPASLVFMVEGTSTSLERVSIRVVDSLVSHPFLVCLTLLLHRILVLKIPLSCIMLLLSGLLGSQSWNAVVSDEAATLVATGHSLRILRGFCLLCPFCTIIVVIARCTFQLFVIHFLVSLISLFRLCNELTKFL